MASYSTDFFEYTAGQQPSDWVERWAGSGDYSWSVISDASAKGGKLLRAVGTNSNRSMLSWSDIDADANRDNVEILVKCRSSSTTGTQLEAAFRATEDEFGYGYRVGLTNGSILEIREYSNEGNVQLDSAAFAWSADTWYWIRARVNGTSLYGKVWADGDAEPGTWAVTATDTTLSAAAYVGLSAYTYTGNKDFDEIVVATNGETASLGSTIVASGIASGEAFGTPAAIYAGAISPLGVTSGEAVGSPALTLETVGSGAISTIGPLVNGGSLTINGSGFGAKDQAAPLLWENWQNGVVGNEIVGYDDWQQYAPDYWTGYGEPYWDDTRAYGAGETQAVRKDFENTGGNGGDFHTAWRYLNSNSPEIYYSMRLYWVVNDSMGDAVWKFNRFNAVDAYDGPTTYGNTYRPPGEWNQHYYWSTTGENYFIDIGAANPDMERPLPNRWNRLEGQYKIHSTEGIAKSWVNQELQMNRSGVNTGATGYTVDTFILPFMAANPYMAWTAWVAQLWIDTTPARVEIGNAPSWGDCTIREPQPATTWNDSQIVVTLNQGALDTLSNKWLYVVRDDGTLLSSSGFDLSGESADPSSYYTTDFSEYSVGVQPSDWTERWTDTNSDWAPVTGGGTVGGQILEHTATAAARRLLSWNDVDGDTYRADCETLALVQSTTADWGVHLRLRASGTAGLETGYNLALRGSTIAVTRFLDGSTVLLGESAFSRTSSDWVWLRFRAEGTAVKAKAWLDGDAEPATWDIEVTNSDISAAGWVGIGAADIDGARVIDYFSVATGGGTAQIPNQYQVVYPDAIASAETFGTPTVSSNEIRPVGVSSGEVFGVPVVFSLGDIQPYGIESDEGFGAPVFAGPIIVEVGIPSAEAFGTFVTVLEIELAGIPSGEAFGTPDLPPAQTEVFISNFALSLLGAEPISSMTEDSTPARACNTNYYLVRDAELRRHPWTFALRREVLVPASTTPGFNYEYEYNLPTDFVRLHPDYDYAEESDWKIEGRKILTNEDVLYLRYVARIADTSLFDDLFTEAIGVKLAYVLCEPLTQSNTKKLELAEYYIRVIRDAKSVNAIERPSAHPPRDTWISRR